MRLRSGRSQIHSFLVDFPSASEALYGKHHASEPYEERLRRMMQVFLSRVRRGDFPRATSFSNQEQVLSATMRMDQSLIIVQVYLLLKDQLYSLLLFSLQFFQKNSYLPAIKKSQKS